VKGPRANTDVGTPTDASRPFVKGIQGGQASCGSWGCTEGGWLSPKPRTSTEWFYVLAGRGSVQTPDGREFSSGRVTSWSCQEAGPGDGTSRSAYTRFGSCTSTKTYRARIKSRWSSREKSCFAAMDAATRPSSVPRLHAASRRTTSAPRARARGCAPPGRSTCLRVPSRRCSSWSRARCF
jgi:hypothetical protein